MFWNIAATIGISLGMFILVINNEKEKTYLGYILGIGMIGSGIAVLMGY